MRVFSARNNKSRVDLQSVSVVLRNTRSAEFSARRERYCFDILRAYSNYITRAARAHSAPAILVFAIKHNESPDTRRAKTHFAAVGGPAEALR